MKRTKGICEIVDVMFADGRDSKSEEDATDRDINKVIDTTKKMNLPQKILWVEYIKIVASGNPYTDAARSLIKAVAILAAMNTVEKENKQ